MHTDRPSRWLPWSGWLAAALATGWFGLVTLWYPFGRDQGNYAYSALVWLHGGMPYADVYVFKPPMTTFTHALATALFGANQLAIRLLDLGWTALTAALLASISFRLLGRLPAAIGTAVAFPFVYFTMKHWDLAQADGFANLFLAAALLALLVAHDLLDDDRRAREAGAGGTDPSAPFAGRLRWLPWLWLGAGVCVGLGAGYKYTAGAFALPMTLVLLATAWRHPRWVVVSFSMVAIGGAGVLFAGLAWLGANGAWEAFADSQFDLVPKYVANTAKRKGWSAFTYFWRKVYTTEWTATMGWVSGLGAVPALAWLVRGPGRARAFVGLAALWWAIAAASTISQGKFFYYHFLLLMAPAALFGGLLVHMVWTPLAARLPRGAAHVALGAVLVVGSTAGAPYRDRVVDLWPVWTGQQTTFDYWDSHEWYVRKNYEPGDVVSMVAWLKENTAPTDLVFHWGYDPSINYLSERHTPSRFLYNYPFRVSFASKAYKPELLAELDERPPDWIVVGSGDATKAVTNNTKSSRRLLRDWDELNDFVKTNYRKIKTIRRYTVYKRRTPGGDR